MRWHAGTTLFVLFLAVLLAYGNIFDQEFVYDDRELVVDNPLIRSLSRVPEIFSTHYWAGTRDRSNLFRPVVVASLALNYATGDLVPRDYKVTNFFLHLLCAWLVYGLACAVTRREGVAAAAALLFAVHPLHTEAVTSIVGRTELLWTFFGLTALYLWTRLPVLGSGQTFRSSDRIRYGLALLSFLLALLSKESAVLLPLFFVLLDAQRHSAGRTGHRLAGGLVMTVRSGIRGRYLGVAAAVAYYLLLRWRVLGFLTLGGGASIPKLDNPLAHTDLLPQVLTAFKLFFRYLGQHAWPFDLSADYSFNQVPVTRTFFDVEVLAGLVLALSLAAVLIFSRFVASRYVFPLWIWGFPLLAASNLWMPHITLYAERLTYMPSVGFALLVAMGGSAVWQRLADRGKNSLPWMATTGVVVFLAFLTYSRNRVWSNEGVFFEAMAADAPQSARARHNWGSFLAGLGQLDAAERELRQALEIMPELGAVHVNLGLIQEARQDLEAAEAEYRQALSLDPQLAEGHNNLGKILKETGRLQESLQTYVTAVRIAPNQWRYRFNLANTLAQLGLHDDAVAQYGQALRLNPVHAPSYYNLGNTLSQLGRVLEAEQAYEAFRRLSEGADVRP